MAETAGLMYEIDGDLRYDHLIVDDLPYYAQDWDERTEDDRTAFSLDWDQALGSRLQFLQKEYTAGTMTPGQRTGYEDLLCKLRELLPTIKRLDLYLPPGLLAVWQSSGP